MKKSSKISEERECPLDKDELGNATWKFLHTMAAYYPDSPTSAQQQNMSNFFKLFSRFYPCDFCAADFRDSLREFPPVTKNQKTLSLWLCERHNEVNEKLGKPLFDCSKVVVSLAVAVKEIVENSLDAGATNVEIKFKDRGLDSIEVSDNGCGIHENDFEALGVETYGFRGEAISSLCALSEVTVITKHKAAARASKLVYDRHGKISEHVVASRQVGTTITLAKLFETFPVRRQQFMSCLKNEFAKAEEILIGYALVRNGVRFSCSNVHSNGKLSPVLRTQGRGSMKEAIVEVFGPKLAQTVIPFVQIPPTEDILGEYNLSNHSGEVSDLFSVEGFVSSCRHGDGRSAPDKTYFFVDSRPCDLPSIAKVIRNVYQQFNRNQYPFVCLNIAVKKGAVDVNVTPDKRKVMLHHEKLFLATVKSSLIEMYQNIPSQIPTIDSSRTILDVTSTKSTNEENSEEKLTFAASIASRFSSSSPGHRFSSERKRLSVNTLEFRAKENSKQRKLDTYFGKCDDSSSKAQTEVDQVFGCTGSQRNNSSKNRFSAFACSVDEFVSADQRTITLNEASTSEIERASTNEQTYVEERSENTLEFRMLSESSDISKISLPEIVFKILGKSCEMESGPILSDKFVRVSSCEEDDKLFDLSGEHASEGRRMNGCAADMVLNINLEEISELVRSSSLVSQSDSGCQLKFRAKIEPGQNVSAEEELKRELSKDSFKKMNIVGQYNKGFIVALFGDDLFIVDQHASDEKWNFEQLQKKTKISGQKLMAPIKMELTLSNEAILVDNLLCFQKLGYDFLIDDDERVGRRVKIVQVPHSKQCVFGVKEIEEMIFQLGGGSDDGDDVRTIWTGSCGPKPAAMWRMFAYRACHTAVRIGMDLRFSDMRRILDNMSSMDSPWDRLRDSYLFLPTNVGLSSWSSNDPAHVQPPNVEGRHRGNLKDRSLMKIL
ncbi:unnamed protein product [Notodromas monacha]|uniref:Sulfhydryl oxidase n=1 Tax=Notodromas monacha TaxID=399045 RepID=A0A7R9BRE7_9CRUS|nr:unnamed protein product [Notodromas monacha]CAG0920313.1 unnamed protein product [Notodromas monacha]